MPANTDTPMPTMTPPPNSQPDGPMTPPEPTDSTQPDDPPFGGLFPPTLPPPPTAAASRSKPTARSAQSGRGWSYIIDRPHPLPQECTGAIWHYAGEFWYYACGWYQRPLPGLGVGYYQENINYYEYWYGYPGQPWQFWISYQQKW
jgi:hypothetical protein